MANHKGAVPEFLNSEYLENILKQIENSQDVKVSNVDITPGSVEGDNYACQIFRILVHFKLNNTEKKMSLIGKYKVMTKLIEGIELIIDPFAIEAHFFNDMPALFKKVLNKTELDFLPKCHYLDWKNNIIIMEDLVALNYKLQPRGELLNKKQCILVVESLAEMHGASYGALKIQPDLKDKYKNSLFKNKAEGPLKLIVNNSLKCLKESIKIYGLPAKQEEELLKLQEKLDTQWFSVCEFEEDQLNVLLHGDCWMNNMMFHTSGDKVKLLDFQIYNFNCFANDLQYFLFTSVAAEVIVNNIDFIIETYYKKLRSVAPDIPNLTLDRVKKEFARRNFFGYALAIAFRPAISTNPPPDFDKLMDGKEVPISYDSETYKHDLPILMSYFEKVRVF